MLRTFLMIVSFFAVYLYLPILQTSGTNLTENERDISHLNSTDYKDVSTAEGVVRGWAAEDGDYYSFLGIPYADYNGNHRFQAPLRPSPYHGIRNGNRKVECPQRNTGDPNCLILNIFTPKVMTESPLPVLVYIHGGSFLIGAAPTEGIDPLMKEDIIVVTVNYRLGPLGFLCLGIHEASGNAGLKDQLAAIKWVNRNINNFGGDHTKVTVYGMSAGASSVEYQILANGSRGLFQRAILESGSANAVFSLDPTPVATAKELSQLLGFPEVHGVLELVEYYQNVSIDVLTQMNYEFYYNKTDGLFGLVPCVENGHCINAYITESPYDILSNDRYDKVPLMVLFTSLEGLFLNSEKFYEADYPNRMESNFSEFLPADLVFDNIHVKEDIANLIKNYYFKNETVGNKTKMEFLNYFGDVLVLRSLLDAVRFHCKSNNPVYLMEFAYKGKMGSYEEFYKNIQLAGHGDVVKHAMLLKPILDDMDKLTVDRVAKLVGNFVKYGNPTPETSQLLPVTWPLFRPDTMSYLYLNMEFEVLENPRQEMIAFWDNFYSKHRRQVVPVDPDDFVKTNI